MSSLVILLSIFFMQGFQDITRTITSKEVKAKWDLLETIQSNTEDWDNDKGKEPGINYEYDCIKSFAETANFQELTAKYGLYPQILVRFYRAFASHINAPK